MNFDTLFIVLKMLFLNNSTGKIMKNFFNVTYRNGSKAVAIFFILMLVIGFIASLAGCGSDNPVGGNGNPPGEITVLSIDSVGLTSILPAIKDTVCLINLSEIDSGKITFELVSNFPSSVNIIAAITSTSTDTNSVNFIWIIPFGQTQNESFDVGFTPSSIHDRIKIRVGFTLSGPPTETNISIKNFKLVKLR